MVDFNNQTTVATPSKDVMSIYLLEKKANTEEALGWYMEKELNNIDADLSKVKIKLLLWYLQLEPMMNRHWKDQEEEVPRDKLLHTIQTGDLPTLTRLIIKFNNLMDRIMITRLDTRERRQKSWEASNIQYGH